MTDKYADSGDEFADFDHLDTTSQEPWAWHFPILEQPPEFDFPGTDNLISEPMDTMDQAEIEMTTQRHHADVISSRFATTGHEVSRKARKEALMEYLKTELPRVVEYKRHPSELVAEIRAEFPEFQKSYGRVRDIFYLLSGKYHRQHLWPTLELARERLVRDNPAIIPQTKFYKWNRERTVMAAKKLFEQNMPLHSVAKKLGIKYNKLYKLAGSDERLLKWHPPVLSHAAAEAAVTITSLSTKRTAPGTA